jgi:hypothetical protein
MAEIGSSRPLRRVPTRVRLLNRLPTLDLAGGDYSSCPLRDLRDQLGNWLSRAPAAFRRAPKTALTLALVFLVAFAALFTATVLEFA